MTEAAELGKETVLLEEDKAETDADRLRRGVPGQYGEQAHDAVTDDITAEDVTEHQHQAEGDQPAPEEPAAAAPIRREQKLVLSLKPENDGTWSARMAVGANECDPVMRVATVPNVRAAVDALLQLAHDASAQWAERPRYPAPPKPAPPPRQPAGRTRAAQRPAAGATPAPAATAATTPPAPAPAAPAQPGVKLQRQVGPDGKTRFVRAAPPEQQSLFGDQPTTT